MNDLELEINQLLSWYSIRRKYISGVVLTVIGAFLLIVGLIVLLYPFPDQLIYHYDVLIYNGALIRLYWIVGITVIGGLFLLIGLPLLIINTKKKKKLR